MGTNSKIEWCDHTFNPWIGCSKVSPGCLNCYAEREDNRRGWTPDGWGAGKPRRRTSSTNWKQPLHWDSEAKKSGVRQRVFCASLADWLDDEVQIDWLADLLDLIRRTPNLDWLLLTKRPKNWKLRLQVANGHLANLGDIDKFDTCPNLATAYFASEWLAGNPPPNVWIGTTAEDQQRYDERIGDLCAIPANVRFLSVEPLLGPIGLGLSANLPGDPLRWYRPVASMIHWVIIGGESGPNARPMHSNWASAIVKQCATTGTPVLFKQWGEWLPHGQSAPDPSKLPNMLPPGAWHAWPDGARAIRIGKKHAGRLLDGVEYNDFPKVV